MNPMYLLRTLLLALAALAASLPILAQESIDAETEVPTTSLTGPIGLLVHPDYTPDQARLVYQPLVDYLTAATGLQIRLMVTRNFHTYWLDARRDRAPELVLEDAHMAAWRMREFGYSPLAAAAAPKTFSLITGSPMADDPIRAFVGRRISTLPSPSLGFLVLIDWFPNPLQQPQINSAATSWLDAVEMVFSGEADAAVAPDNIVAKYPNLYPVATSPEFPGLTLSAAASVPEDVRRQLVDALTVLHENPDHHDALFELDIDRFIEADPDDYRGLERWLDKIFTM
ncbi:MAG: hypothetical protein Kow0020_00990 [Wenzhouxiangellaceae bacterium]